MSQFVQSKMKVSSSGILLAHQTQISGTVGGTHHFEPNDTPRAGEPNLAWFALTQAGGETIPLGDCDCELAVYPGIDPSPNATPIATPALKAISAEGLQNIPAAEILFPKVGAYELVLRGRPQGTATFEPFELQFSVTVAAGKVTDTVTDKKVVDKDVASTSAPTTSLPTTSAPTPSNPSTTNSFPPRIGIVSGVGLAALVALGLVLWKTLQRSV